MSKPTDSPMMEFYDKIRAENEKLTASMQKTKEKIDANNKRCNNKIISDLEQLCKAGKLTMTDVLRIIGAAAENGVTADEAVSRLSRRRTAAVESAEDSVERNGEQND